MLFFDPVLRFLPWLVFGQGLFLSIAVLSRWNHRSNRFLGTFLMLLSFHGLIALAWQDPSMQAVPLLSVFFSGLPFLYGPLMYRYVWHSLYRDWSGGRPFIVHTIPAFLNVAIYGGILLLVGLDEYNSIAIDVFEGGGPLYVRAIEALKIIMGIFYAILIIRLLYRNRDALRRWASKEQRMQWLKWLVLAFAMSWVLVLISALLVYRKGASREIGLTVNAPLIIMLHGGPGGDYRSILPLIELVDDGYRVLFYDQRGSGLSPRVGEEELILDRYIADLDLFKEYFSPGKPVALVGHSWGAMLASAYIGVHPEKVDRMVLAEPGMLDDEHGRMFFEKTGLDKMKPSSKVIAALISAWAESLHIKGPDSQARQDYLINAYFTTPLPENPLSGYYPEGKMENTAGKDWRFGSLASSAIQASGMNKEGNLMNLATGGVEWSKKGRAIFISGSENRIIGPDYQRSQMHYYPGSELVVIDGAGHTMFGEKPVESLAAIRSFLEEWDEGRPGNHASIPSPEHPGRKYSAEGPRRRLNRE